jgi:thiosulfate dehydrogenase
MSTLHPLIPLLVLAACAAPDGPPVASPDSAADSTVNYAIAPIPDGPLGASIRRGAAILQATIDSLPEHVGNDLNCNSCHLDQGLRPNAIPYVGVYARFPQFNARAARVFNLEDRINGCLQRSMNGQPLDEEDPRMRAMVAYMAHVSKGIAVGATVPGQGLPGLQALEGDTIRGRQLWGQQCARCHGPDGQGTPLAPPTWGPRSFNIGAGMSRIRTAAGFIRHNMPFDTPGSLSDDQAIDIAAYLISRPRPDFPGKENDWPQGGAPADGAYEVKSAQQ